MIPSGLHSVKGVTNEYIRDCKTIRFNALDITTFDVITQCKTKNFRKMFLVFLRQIKASVGAGLDFHVILDNTYAHKLDKTRP